MEKTEDEQLNMNDNTSNLCIECESLRSENKDLCQRVNQLEGRLQYVEDESRAKNLLFYGISQRPSALEYRQDVLEVVRDVLGLQRVAVERVYRSGTAVIVRFVSRSDRDSVLSNVRRLRGTQFSVREDVSPTVRQKQNGLLPWYKDLRRQKKKANIFQDRLITKEGVFTFDLNTKKVVRVKQNGGKSRRCCKSRPQHQDAAMTSCRDVSDNHWPQSGARTRDSGCTRSEDERISQQSKYPPPLAGCDSSSMTEADADLTKVFSPLSTSDTMDMLADMSMDSGFSTLTSSSTLQASSLFTSQSYTGPDADQEGKRSVEGCVLPHKNTTTKQPRFSTPGPCNPRPRFPSDPLCSHYEGRNNRMSLCKNCGYQETETDVSICRMKDAFVRSIDRNKSTHTENNCNIRPYTMETCTQTDATDRVLSPQENRFGYGQLEAATIDLISSSTQTEDCDSHTHNYLKSEKEDSGGTNISRAHTGTEGDPDYKDADGKHSTKHQIHKTGSDSATTRNTAATLPEKTGVLTRPVDTKTGNPSRSYGVQLLHNPGTDTVPVDLKPQDSALSPRYCDSAEENQSICSVRQTLGGSQGNEGSNPANIPKPSHDSSTNTKSSKKSSKPSKSFREAAERDVGWHRSGGQWYYSHRRATGDDAEQHPANREALKPDLECVVPPSPLSPTPPSPAPAPTPLVNGSGGGGLPLHLPPPPPSFFPGGSCDDGDGDGGGGGGGDSLEGGGGGGGRGRRVTTMQVQDRISLKLSEKKDSILQPIKEDLSEWITRIIGVQITPDTFLEALDSGVALCTISKLIEKHAQEYAKQGKLNEPLPSFKLRCNTRAKSGTWFSRDNATNFLGWCRAYGMTDETMFDSEDLVSHKQEKPIINCVLELARIGWRYGIEPPNLIRLEREIEKQAQEFEPPPYVPPPPPSPPPPPPPPPPIVEKHVDPPVKVKKPEKIELHKEVKRLAHKCKCQAYVNRISEGVYDVFGKRVFIRLLHGQHLMVRVGGGWDTFENYLLHHDPIQVYEFRRPVSRETLKADFDGYLVIRSKYKS